MKIKYNIFFIPLLILIGVAVWYLGFRETKISAAKRLSDRALVDAGKIDVIEIIKPESTIRLEKEASEKWIMVSPYKADCDSGAVSKIEEAILTAESERDLPDVAEEKQEEYGLKNPGLRIRLASSGGSVMMDLAVGENNPSGSSKYSAFEGSLDKVFLVPVYFLEPFNVSPEDIRDRTAIAFNTDNLESIRLLSPVADLKIEREAGRWYVTEPEKFPASDKRVEQVIHDISDLKAAEFLPANASDPQLSENRVDVTLGFSDKTTKSLTLHGEDLKRGIFVTSSTQPSPFITEAYIYDRVALSPDVFFHILLIDMPTEEIERILVRQPSSQNLEIKRTGKKIEEWQILRPEDRLYTDPGDFENFIDSLLALEPKKNIPPPKQSSDYGIYPAYFMKVEVYREKDGGHVYIYLGNIDNNDDYYASLDGNSYFTIDGRLVDGFIERLDKLRGTIK
ncbi:MAG: DUF4340 domain-containing protein [bacterium]